jgi:putative endonuclease
LRLERHNSGFYSDSFSSKGIPWELKLKFECENSKKAYVLERFIKRMKSRKFLEKVIDYPSILEDILLKL